ncbi:hypothetical protein ACP4OV_024075 [Aristida adscensionis]
MGRRKRARGRDGAGVRAPLDKPEPPHRDLEREEGGKDLGIPSVESDHRMQDKNQMRMAGGESDGGRANGDEHTEDKDQMGIAGGDLDDGRKSSAYLVACHWDWAMSSKPYCVYKMVDASPSDESSPATASRKRLKRLGRVKTIDGGGKMFVAARPGGRPWIVGVGGNNGDTVVFDTKTGEAIEGPNLNSAKWCPVLTTVGDKVYAMTRALSWTRDPNFPPWFEVLDLSKATVVVAGSGSSHLEGCSWSSLPHPPCIPWELTPLQYTMLPIVVLVSYVVVGPYILVSFNNPQWGTWGFDTNSDEWHKVDDERLPFVGGATQHAGSIFLGLSGRKGPVSAYRIHVATSDNEHALKLSITALPVKYMEDEVATGSCISSLDNGHFCSLSLSIDGNNSYTYLPQCNGLIPRNVYVNLKTYQIEDPSLLETSEEILLAVKPIAISNQWEQVLKISSSKHGFTPFAFALLSI